MNRQEAITTLAELSAAVQRGSDKALAGDKGRRHSEHWIVVLQKFDYPVGLRSVEIAREQFDIFPSISAFRAILLSEARRQHRPVAIEATRCPPDAFAEGLRQARAAVAAADPTMEKA